VALALPAKLRETVKHQEKSIAHERRQRRKAPRLAEQQRQDLQDEPARLQALAQQSKDRLP
jgi:hypothetical protein